jgi:hypothetical protein
MSLQTIAEVALAVATTAAACAAAVAARASQETVKIMEKQHNESIKQAKDYNDASLDLATEGTKSRVFLECLGQYLSIMSKEARAIQDNEMAYAYDSQRALIDLVWFEFHLWRKGHVDDENFYAWMDTRRRSYSGGQPELKFNKDGRPEYMTTYAIANHDANDDTVVVSYKRVWDHVESTHYYPSEDKYLQLMKQIHDKDGRGIHQIMDDFREGVG